MQWTRLLLILSLATSVAVAADGDDDAPVSDDPKVIVQRAVRLAWSGGSGGIDAGTYFFAMHDRMGQAGAPDLTSVSANHAWMAQGDWLLAANDRSLQSTLQLFAGEKPTCVAPRSVTLLRTPAELAIFDDDAPSWTTFWPAARIPGTRWSCSTAQTSADLIGPRDADPAALSWTLGTWESRLSLTWTLAPPDAAEGSDRDAAAEEHIAIIGRPIGDGPRRARQLLELVQDGVLFVDAGGFVAGVSSVRDDQLSAHRPTALALLRRLKPTALAPAREELAGGARYLIEESSDLPWVATNWTAEDPKLQLDRVRTVVVDSAGGAVRVAFLSALDPRLHEQLPSLASQGITLGDPVDAIRDEIRKLRAQSEPPDLIVVLSSAGPGEQARLRTKVRGIDLLLGDPSDSLSRVDSLELTLDPSGSDRRPIALPGDPLMLGEIVFEPGSGLAAIFARPQPIDLDAPPDAEVLADVTAVRARVFPPLDRPLLPAPAGPPGSTLSDTAFARIVCEAIRIQVDADIVFLPDLPASANVPGALSTLLAVRRLRVPDHLELHRIPGDRLGRLLDQLYGSDIDHCGTTVGSRSPTVGGRAIEADQMYRVITTDRQRLGTSVGPLIDAARAPAALDGTGYSTLRDEDGRPQSLRATAIGALSTLREEHGDDLLRYLLTRRTAPPPPRWLFRVQTLSLRIEGFQGAEDPAYARVPETLATSPSSFTLGTAADLGFQYNDQRAGWDLRVRHAFTRLRTAELVQETADDLRLSSSVTLPGLTTPSLFGIAARPYGEGLLDSEWTPIVNAEGETLPRQLDLSFTIGLAAQPKGILRTLRLGVIGMQDLSRTDKQSNLGGRVEAETVVPFGPGLRWASQLSTIAYLNTPDQDERDLRFRALLDSRVALPLLRGLDIAVYGNLFVFQGRVPATSNVRQSFTLGASLDARGLFLLNR